MKCKPLKAGESNDIKQEKRAVTNTLASRSSSTAQQSGAGKLEMQWWEENSTGEGGKPTSHVSCKQTRRPEKTGVVSPPPVCLERGNLVAVAHAQENSE
jgi:hypothetical protein